MGGKSLDQEVKGLFGRLAQVEVGHERRLFAAYERLVPGSQDLESFEAAIVPDTLEGGFNAAEFLETNKAYLQTVPQVLDLAMMLETQALDLYLRFADRCEPAPTKEVLFTLAGEEKAHLASLGRLGRKVGKARLKFMAITVMEVLKNLPRTNCGDCGQPTCLAFATHVIKEGEDLDKCPHLTGAGAGIGEKVRAQQEAGVGRRRESVAISLEVLQEKVAPLDFVALAEGLGATYGEEAGRPYLSLTYFGHPLQVFKDEVRYPPGAPADPWTPSCCIITSPPRARSRWRAGGSPITACPTRCPRPRPWPAWSKSWRTTSPVRPPNSRSGPCNWGARW